MQPHRTKEGKISDRRPVVLVTQIHRIGHLRAEDLKQGGAKLAETGVRSHLQMKQLNTEHMQPYDVQYINISSMLLFMTALGRYVRNHQQLKAAANAIANTKVKDAARVVPAPVC